MVHIFILDSFAGGQLNGEDLDAQLKNIDNLDYYIFSLRSPEDKEGLVRKIQEFFEDEKIRIYICGRSQTVTTILNELKSVEDVELAYIPSGTDTDILKVFRKNEEKFRDVTKMVNGDVVKIDYIRTNHGICLNAVSVGVDFTNSRIIRNQFSWEWMYRLYKELWITCKFLKARPKRAELLLDDVELQDDYSLVFFGNGFSLAGKLYFSDYTFINDGKAMINVTPAQNTRNMMRLFHALRRKNLGTLGKMTRTFYSRRMTMRLEDDGYTPVYLDGIPCEERGEWTIEIIPEGLKFVLPKGVSL